MSGFVFVSHSTADGAYVGRLAAHLQAAGIPAWVDTARMRPGDRWEQVVRDQVDACAVMLVVMSPAAEASPHVANEIDRARRQGKPFLPLLLDGEPFFALGALHYGDARGGVVPDDRFVTRLAELAAGGGRPSRPGEPAAGGRWLDQVVVGDLPGAAVAWQERPELLGRLAGLAHGGGTAVVCALAGQRGVGKTQVAAAYARMRVQHGWPVVVWAVADTTERIVTTLDELATVAGVRQPDADPQQAARAALRWLRAQPGPVLLVYDNALDADLIREWTPPVGQVHTVVTTTRRELDSLGDLIDVDLFTDAEAIAYLTERTGLPDPDGAAEVADALGRLPLALAQAGSIIGGRRRYPSYGKYLRHLSATPTAALLPRTPGDPYPHGVAEAILLSLDDLAAADPHRHARRLLDHLAVLAPTGADSTLLHHLTAAPTADADSPDEPVDVDTIVAVLAGRSLTVPTVDVDRTVVHRLVQRVVRERCQHTGTLDTVIATAADAVRDAAAHVGNAWATRALIGEYATHVDTLWRHAPNDTTRRHLLTVRLWMLHWLRKVHNYTAAIALGPDLLRDCEHTLGDNHDTTLVTRNNLAQVYDAVGRLDEAIDLLTRTLADRERVLGPDHPHALTLRNNLASAYETAGRLDEAIDLYTRNLTHRERVLGPDHPGTLTSRNNLAYAYRAAGRLDEAIELYTRTLAGCERVLGPDHTDTLNSRNNLASAYQAVGRLNEAIDLHTRTLADYERVLGPDHPDTLTSRNNLASAYEAAGRLDEAIDLLTRTLTDRERVLGPDHPHTLTSRNNLANAYRTAGRLDEAAALGKR
ncbi:MAG TPA: tetratricopeptide repeat protein [Pilimelia sp.]|nr:tetratricopeptide repeat protein [Pilimelia sp.]